MVNSDPMGCTHRQLKTKKWHIRSDINIYSFFHVFNIHFTTLLVLTLAGTKFQDFGDTVFRGDLFLRFQETGMKKGIKS